MRYQSLLSGCISCLPGGNEWLFARNRRRHPNAGMRSARCCYSYWLRHLVLVNATGALSGVPGAVAELGPGTSLGVGLAALICGVDKYSALDMVRHSGSNKCVSTFDEIVELYRSQADIPGSEEFPSIFATLEDYSFPSHILSDDHMKAVLADDRIAALRAELEDIEAGAERTASISFVAPWNSEGILDKGSIDLIISRDVLEHVDDLEITFLRFSQWLQPSGAMSHEIDYKAHGHSSEWNGHWVYEDWVWRIIRGRRPFLLNREPHSSYISLHKTYRFDVIYEKELREISNLSASDLAKEFRNMSEDDLHTKGSHLVSVKDSRL